MMDPNLSQAYKLSRNIYDARQVATLLPNTMVDGTCPRFRWIRRPQDVMDTVKHVTPATPRPPHTAGEWQRGRRVVCRSTNTKNQQHFITPKRKNDDLIMHEEAGFLPALDQALEDTLAREYGTSERMIRHDRTWRSQDTIKKIHRHARSPRENPAFTESRRFNRCSIVNRKQPHVEGDVVPGAVIPGHPVLDVIRGSGAKLYAYELSRLYEQDIECGGRAFTDSFTRYSNDPDEVLSSVYGPGGASTGGYLMDASSPTLNRLRRQGRDHLLKTYIPKLSRTARNPYGLINSTVYSDGGGPTSPRFGKPARALRKAINFASITSQIPSPSPPRMASPPRAESLVVLEESRANTPAVFT